MKSMMTSILESLSERSGWRRPWTGPVRAGVTALAAFVLVTTPVVAAGAASSTSIEETTSTTSVATTSSTTLPTTSATPPAAPHRPYITAAGIAGTGSSFASPAVTSWAGTVGQAPYNISVNYTPSNSGQGRYEFTNGTVDYAVSDTGYVSSNVGTTPPSFPYEFLPITAAGVAFMYNIPGLTQTLQLTSYTACLLLTGQIKNWDDPALKQSGANAGVTLPNLPVVPVTESDPAGTNFVLEEYCIDEQPAVWAQYAKNVAGSPPPSGVPINATTPGSNWEAPGNGYDESSTPAVASNVVNSAGAIGAVQENYATDSGFTGSNPAKAVAEMQNASGKFTLPTPVDVASALAYATQLANGTHQAQLQRIGSECLQPVDLQLPADTDHRMGRRQGGHHEPVRELRADPRPAGGTEIRIRQPGPFARALRYRPGHRQCSRRRRPDSGRERCLRVRRPDTRQRSRPARRLPPVA